MKNFFKMLTAMIVFLVTLGSLVKWLGEKSNEKYIVVDQSGNEIY